VTLPARLLGIRLQGFKSFAERTVIEFGGGISAIVGPNGSGKSNLADALRWALGEQGRALRSRRSEDVIWAGSERRAALGMADVTLVLDNADRLLAVDYGVLELGRRLYRSGENDYLLNRQRVRLRDLIDLLDAAHLADNAFLFIGQGMVDQALALRPEERRPLFEEVAGVRRHERRRRRAEEQLAESEANLARAEDILAELRPQARRLAAQAEQQATRRSVGDELAEALLSVAHGRWHEGAARAAAASGRHRRARSDADRAMAELAVAEEAAGAIAAALAGRAVAEREREAEHEAARGVLTDLRLREARAGSDLAAIERDRRRLADEAASIEADLAAARRILTEPRPPRNLELEAALAEAEAALGEALGELGALRAAGGARGEALAAIRRAAAAREAELQSAHRRLAETERRAREERDRATESAAVRAVLQARVDAARAAVAAAAAAAEAATASREAARAAAEAREGERTVAVRSAAGSEERLAALRERLATLEQRLVEEEAGGLGRAARAVGGRRLDDELAVETSLRAAVEAVLAELAGAFVVRRSAVTGLTERRGVLVVGDLAPDPAAEGPSDDATRSAFLERLGALGGGPLADAVRRDGTGVARRLLARAAWAPDLATALELQPSLPPGWVVAVRDGSAVVRDLVVAVGRGEATLERRAEATRLRAEIDRQERETVDQRAAADAATEAAAGTRDDLAATREAEALSAAERGRAVEVERLAAGVLEDAARETAWLEAQATRLEAEADRARSELAALGPSAGGAKPGADVSNARDDDADPGAIAAWDARAAELRARRDRLAAEGASQESVRRAADARQAGAEAANRLAEERRGRCDADRMAVDERERTIAVEREGMAAELAAATAGEAHARAALEALRASDAGDRDRLAAAESAVAASRDRLRAAEERLRAAEVGDVEARFALDSVREQLLVELAALGELGLRHLSDALPVAGRLPVPATEDGDDAAAFEAALAAVAPHWAATEPDGGPAPGRLTALRRRYHELGAANPFADEEYAEVRARLDSLEAQGADLRAAIARTRSLIDELNTLIAEQFRATFRALEAAFDARFRQLFGGGFARLELTEPSDLSVTGVEIVARPPGKKPGALAMLSGGERALTAVALLFAMLEVRPVPFCVLDEVDAALDEANIGRFAEALRGLTGQTQFIVITHNRGTIEAADALYGVTAGDDSVSRVISLRLDEAAEIAERAREARAVLVERSAG
jgi:chromosome segregation protein